MFFDKKKIKNFEIISFEHLIVEIENNHLAITLNRANKKNALNSKMIEELAICTDYANFNDSIRAVIYRSDGDTFCSGLDLNDFKDSKNSIQLADIFNKLHKPKLVVLATNLIHKAHLSTQMKTGYVMNLTRISTKMKSTILKTHCHLNQIKCLKVSKEIWMSQLKSPTQSRL